MISSSEPHPSSSLAADIWDSASQTLFSNETDSLILPTPHVCVIPFTCPVFQRLNKRFTSSDHIVRIVRSLHLKILSLTAVPTCFKSEHIVMHLLFVVSIQTGMRSLCLREKTDARFMLPAKFVVLICCCSKALPYTPPKKQCWLLSISNEKTIRTVFVCIKSKRPLSFVLRVV
ncbi:hypothetical protein CSKR_201524 [Clonorchis sinensis]|uniref:Uncharacterized protein n=1 Tax=Clonorchis sinensis TaxID=79923 RepID=A0A8T1MRL3_CLOSI|nr:hypothetical protein CSKR_201524 [Clonorchis sinensis]